MIFLPGGPSHQDMFDLKMDAPSEIRGEFKPIATNVPGIQITEHLPLLAKHADKYALIRSIVGATGGHDAIQCLTGRTNRNMPPGGWPCLGSTLSYLHRNDHKNPGVPKFVGLSPKMGHTPWSNNGQPGFLGVSHSPFKPSKGAAKSDLVLNGVTLDRLEDRKNLLSSFDGFRRDVDAKGLMEGMDSLNQQAFGMLTSSKLLHAPVAKTTASVVKNPLEVSKPSIHPFRWRRSSTLQFSTNSTPRPVS